MLSKKKLFLPVLLLIMAFALTACSDAYIEAFNPAIDQLNEAVTAVNAQLDIINADNSKFTDPQWASDTKSTLAVLRGAGQALKNLPAPDSSDYNRLNSLAGQIGDAAIGFADSLGAAIDAGDISQTDAADAYMNKINELLPQINAEVDRINN
jgi:hypothetical protein